MRVLSGKYKGKNLDCTTDQSIRPTTNRIKEYIFSILIDFCHEKNVADVFAGTGNLGIESLSRGAAHVDFIEYANSSINILQKNLSHLKISSDQFRIYKKDAMVFSNTVTGNYDLILMDPPFKYPPLNDLLSNLFQNNLLKETGIIVVEHEITNPIQPDSIFYDIIKQKKMGRSLISFLTNKGSDRG